MQQILLKVAKIVGKEVLKVAITETAKAVVAMLKEDDNNRSEVV